MASEQNSALVNWRIISPAPSSVVFNLPFRLAFERRNVLAQMRHAESVALYRGKEPIALMMFHRHGWRRTEIAVVLAPDARHYVGRLIRMARLLFSAMAERHLVVVCVRPYYLAAARMATMAGFQRGKLHRKNLWVFRGSEKGGETRPLCLTNRATFH